VASAFEHQFGILQLKQQVDPRRLADAGAKKDTLDQARVRALSRRVELQVPTLVWDQIRKQEMIMQEQELDKQLRAVRLIQATFRDWKQKRWPRVLQAVDVECEELAGQPSTRESAGHFEQHTRARSRSTVRSFERMEQHRTLGQAELHGRLSGRRRGPTVREAADPSRTRREQSILSRRRLSAESQAARPSAVRGLPRVEDDDEDSEVAEEARAKAIERHIHFLRQVNRELFAAVPPELVRPSPAVTAAAALSALRAISCTPRQPRPAFQLPPSSAKGKGQKAARARRVRAAMSEEREPILPGPDGASSSSSNRSRMPHRTSPHARPSSAAMPRQANEALCQESWRDGQGRRPHTAKPL